MTPTSVRDIRNLTLLGQSGSGKTTLLAPAAAAAGAIAPPAPSRRATPSRRRSPGKSLRHSLNASLAHLERAGHWINLLDTPGLPGFPRPRAGHAAGGRDRGGGGQCRIRRRTVTRKMMDAAAEKCRMIVVNRIDAPGVDFAALLERLTAAFGRNACRSTCPPPAASASSTASSRPTTTPCRPSPACAGPDQIVDQVVGVDEDLMALYLEQGESRSPSSSTTLRAGPARRPPDPGVLHLGRTGAGIDELLDIMGRLLPDPTEGNPPQFLKGEGPAAQAVSATTDADQHVIAHVFQVSNDPSAASSACSASTRARSRPTPALHRRRPQALQGRPPAARAGQTQTEIDVGIPGDICAVARIDEIHRDAVLHDSHDGTTSTWPAALPAAGVRPGAAARKARRRAEALEALHRLLDEDPASASSATCRPRRP